MIRRSKVIQTMLLVGAVVMMPLGAVALAPLPAGALTFTPFTCSLGGAMTFDAGTPGQGISKDGWVAGNLGFEISYPTLGGCSGSGGSDFAYQSVACSHKTPGLPASNPACLPGRHGFNSWADALGNVVPQAQFRRGLTRQTFAGAIQGVTGDQRFQWYFA